MYPPIESRTTQSSAITRARRWPDATALSIGWVDRYATPFMRRSAIEAMTPCKTPLFSPMEAPRLMPVFF